MTSQEWEKAISELRDAQLVSQRIFEHAERAWEKRFDALTSSVEMLISAQKQTQSSLESLIANIDRFVQGRDKNGHNGH